MGVTTARRKPSTQMAYPASMDSRLDLILRNLAPLEAVKDFAKLRVVENDAGGGAKDDAITIDTHHLALEDRWVFQGMRRAQTGDGHRITLAFIQHIHSEIEALADRASKAHVHNDPARADSMFELPGLKVLQKLSQANKAAIRGLTRLRLTTYAGSEQIAVDLTNLIGRSETISDQIDAYVLRAAGGAAPAAGPLVVDGSGPWP